MPKVWLQQRWEMVKPVLEELTVDQEDQVKQVCEDEKQAWAARPTMKRRSSLKEPMTDMRNLIRALPLTERNSYVNEKTREREHIALKYLNYTEAEWAEINAASNERVEQRERKFIDQPDAVVAKAEELLRSEKWWDLAVGLAVATGRRLSEVLREGHFHPKSEYILIFSGQLKKRQDKTLRPYEIPTLVKASLVLEAIARLRGAVDTTGVEIDQISVKYGPAVSETARRHFSDLVPERAGADLYTHLFRSVYGRIATHYYAKPTTMDLEYMATIYGHYWVKNATDEKQRLNYASTLHYFDYVIGDGKGNIDGRHGVKLGEPGVELIQEYREKKEPLGVPSKKKGQSMDLLEKKKDHSITRMAQETKSRIDQVHQDLKYRTQDETLSKLVDEHYELQQIVGLLKPLYEKLGVESPVAAVQALVSEGSTHQIDERLGAVYKTSLAEVVDLLESASGHAANDKPYQKEYDSTVKVLIGKANEVKDPSPLQKKLKSALSEKGIEHGSTMPVLYLQGMLAAKESFLGSYEKRHKDKDYSKMSLSVLKNTKTSEAAQERFRRAVDAIMAYNQSVNMPELQWYVSAAVINDLVGGRPGDIKEFIESDQELREKISAHHEQYGLKPGYNRRAINIRERVTVPEYPEGVEEGEETITSAELVE